MDWITYSILLSVAIAAFAEANRYFQMDGFRLNFWRTVLMAAMLTPAAVLVEWPAPSMFYVAAVFTGLTRTISPAIRLSLSAKKMGRVTTLYMPVDAMSGFLIWLMLDEGLRESLLAKPVTLVLMGFSFALITGALGSLRQNDAGWKAFLIVAPLGVLHALSGSLAKYGMLEYRDMFEIVLLYVFFSHTVAAVLGACFLVARPQARPWCPTGMIRAALVVSFIGLAAQLSFFLALNAAPSPGYVVAVTMLAPVWIMLYYRSRGWPDEANPYAGLTMVAGAMMLVLLAAS